MNVLWSMQLFEMLGACWQYIEKQIPLDECGQHLFECVFFLSAIELCQKLTLMYVILSNGVIFCNNFKLKQDAWVFHRCSTWKQSCLCWIHSTRIHTISVNNGLTCTKRAQKCYYKICFKELGNKKCKRHA